MKPKIAVAKSNLKSHGSRKRYLWTLLIMLLYLVTLSFFFNFPPCGNQNNLQADPSSMTLQQPVPAPQAQAPTTPSPVCRKGKGGPWTKLSRGFSNIFLSPLEIPKYMIKESTEAEPDFAAPIYGVFYGIPEGAGWTGARLFSGLVDVLTFPAEHPKRGWGAVIPIKRFNVEDTREDLASSVYPQL